MGLVLSSNVTLACSYFFILFFRSLSLLVIGPKSLREGGRRERGRKEVTEGEREGRKGEEGGRETKRKTDR